MVGWCSMGTFNDPCFMMTNLVVPRHKRCPTSSSLAEVAMQVKPIIKSKRNTVILHDLPEQIPLEDIYGHMAMDGFWGRCDCGLSIPVINSKWLLFMNYSWHGVKPCKTTNHRCNYWGTMGAGGFTPPSSPVHLATAAQNLATASMASRSRVEDVWAGATGIRPQTSELHGCRILRCSSWGNQTWQLNVIK